MTSKEIVIRLLDDNKISAKDAVQLIEDLNKKVEYVYEPWWVRPYTTTPYYTTTTSSELDWTHKDTQTITST